jgi:hypothetical protein
MKEIATMADHTPRRSSAPADAPAIEEEHVNPYSPKGDSPATTPVNPFAAMAAAIEQIRQTALTLPSSEVLADLLLSLSVVEVKLEALQATPSTDNPVLPFMDTAATPPE